jgi:radical SAM protein with 4Fe4S-binding SPASM domain
LQLTVAMGNAADHPELLLQPYQLLELMPLLAQLHSRARKHGIVLLPGNNIGYFGPYEHLWRSNADDRHHYSGCSAGQTVIGLEADGTVKGCPSLPTVGYAGGNIREIPLEQIWRSSRQSLRPGDDLWGFCESCYYADVCRAGCTWTSHSLLGRPGNNPYCHHRAQTLAAQGVRERVLQVEQAGPAAFAVGRFELIEEGLDGEPLPARDRPATPDPRPSKPRPIVAEALELCHGCNYFVHADDVTCPFCGGDIHDLHAQHEAWRLRVQGLMDEVRKQLPQATAPGPAQDA